VEARKRKLGLQCAQQASQAAQTQRPAQEEAAKLAVNIIPEHQNGDAIGHLQTVEARWLAIRPDNKSVMLSVV
jgi:hypothetical protein